MRKHILILSLLVLSASARAASISSTFSEVLVENLQPGEQYSLSDIASLPYNIRNASDKNIEMSVEVIKPKKGFIRPGFEAIPDSGWVSLREKTLALAPGETKTSDVIIKIPKNSKYLNKKYQAGIWARTVESGGGLAVSAGLESVLLITTDRAFIKSAGPDRGKPGLNFSVRPRELSLSGVSRSTGTVITVTNFNAGECRFRMSSLSSGSALTKPVDGYAYAPDPDFLTFSDREFTLPSGAAKDVAVSVNFPEGKRFSGKKYMFVVYVMAGETGGIYSRILVDTK